MPVKVFFYIMFYIINTMKKHEEDSFVPHAYLQYKKGLDLNLTPSPLFVVTPLYIDASGYFVCQRT